MIMTLSLYSSEYLLIPAIFHGPIRPLHEDVQSIRDDRKDLFPVSHLFWLPPDLASILEASTESMLLAQHLFKHPLAWAML